MTLSVSNVGMSNYAVPFKGSKKEPVLVDKKKFGDKVELVYETEASSGKKWGVGIASTILPGLGQAINGDWGKGALFFLGTIIGTVITNGLGISAVLSENISKSKSLGALGAALGTLAIGIGSIVDAVKSAKSTTSQIVSAQDEV